MRRRNRHRHSYYEFAPYVPVAERKEQAAAKLKQLEKKGVVLQPVTLQGRKIASTFWGKAWCDNLESYMDFANRLPRGRSYVRNGSVLHLEIKHGTIEAKVAGSSLYTVEIQISPAAVAQWNQLCKQCVGQIGSLLELLSGNLSDRVMTVMTGKEFGLFPAPKEIELACSCPDSATMCKHVAAVMYGIGARLDQEPDLLFLLRGVDKAQLISHAVEADITTSAAQADAAPLSDGDLADVFGIDLDAGASKSAEKAATKKTVTKKSKAKKAVAKKPARSVKKSGARKKAAIAKSAPAAVAKAKQPRRKRTLGGSSKKS